jgi:hypothetical protein
MLGLAIVQFARRRTIESLALLAAVGIFIGVDRSPPLMPFMGILSFLVMIALILPRRITSDYRFAVVTGGMAVLVVNVVIFAFTPRVSLLVLRILALAILCTCALRYVVTRSRAKE